MYLDYNHADQIITIHNSNTLWLGDYQSAQNLDFLRKNNIRVVITAASGLQNIKYDSSVRHYRYPFLDIKTESMFEYFDQVTQKIQKGLKWGSVLVHCGAGISRSSTLVLAYLIKYHKFNFLSALKFVKNKRPSICPNLGFELQLKKYSKIHHITHFNPHTINSLTQNFYIPPIQLNTRTYFNPDFQQKTPFPHILHRQKNIITSDTIKQRLTQPKAWRISLSSKPQFKPNTPTSTSLDPINKSQLYIKKIANFRFGKTNTSKWGLL